MPQSNNGERGFTSGEALARGQRVYGDASTSTVKVAGAANEELGVTLESVDSGDNAAVKLRSPSVETIAAGAITIFADVYRAASGRVTASASGSRYGIALEAAAAAADKLEVMPVGLNS